MTNKKEDRLYIRFVQNLLKLFRRLGIAKYSSKYSKHDFTLWQWICLLALKQNEKGKGYRRFIEWLKVSTAIVEELGLKRIPHFTALQKVARRLSMHLMKYVLLGFFFLTGKRIIDGSGDGTGFKSGVASTYYTKILKRINKKKRKRGRPRKRRKIKKHIHPLMLVEVREQLILTTVIRRGPLNESPLIIPLLDELKHLKEKLKRFRYDRAGDAEYIHKHIREKLEAESIIPPRRRDVPVWRTKGTYRKKMKRNFPKKKYNQRNISETINSVIKRMMGEELLSKDWWMQDRELILRFIAYNAYRLARKDIFLFIGGFLRSP